MDDIDKRIIKDCIDVGFDTGEVKTTTVKDKDDNSVQYKKTISYMPELNKVRRGLILLIHDKSKQVARVIDYIERNLRYNETSIILSASTIARFYGDDRSNIRKAIKELEKMDIIRKIDKYIPNNILPKNTYAVNFNYICNGNIHEIKREILKQRNNKDYDSKNQKTS